AGAMAIVDGFLRVRTRVIGLKEMANVEMPGGESKRVERIESREFQRAALNSETSRIIGLLCLLGTLMIYAVASGLAAGGSRLLLAQILVLAVAIAYEALMLAAVKGALRHERDVPPVMWTLSTLIETQLPTIALLLLIRSQLMDPYQALVAPAVFLYFLFIILSTLRLSPFLSFLTGLMSALGYIAVTFYVRRQYPSPVAGPSDFTLYHFIYAGLILAGGIISAVVAGQIRNHVHAALRKAELERELERVNHDLDIARSIQQGLLPSSSPGLLGFEIAGWNQPAEQTGGDYFDWQTLPDGRLAVSLGDATGHGIGPALVTASCRAYARASFLSGDPDSLLDNLNRLLAQDLPDNRFVTFAVVFLDPDGSHVKVLSAGHGPILLYRYAADKVENLEAQGIPLGMIAGVRYGHGTEVRLASGDMLVLVTDGFYEWENPEGEEFGLTRLEAVIRESRDYSAEEVIARLRSAVESFCKGTEQKDDLTAVILRRKAEPVVISRTGEMEAAIFNNSPITATE
ncbi:MAG TPA: PP2C family protein-serine/threonine phosphatase, partial [Blastocatellia bacterium]|nr:PP2C family protein-serine/threonine phosphatase [Blastocatellia bacterium]